MDKKIEVRGREGRAPRWIRYEFLQSTRAHRTFWIGVLYVITIALVLAFVAGLT